MLTHSSLSALPTSSSHPPPGFLRLICRSSNFSRRVRGAMRPSGSYTPCTRRQTCRLVRMGGSLSLTVLKGISGAVLMPFLFGEIFTLSGILSVSTCLLHIRPSTPNSPSCPDMCSCFASKPPDFKIVSTSALTPSASSWVFAPEHRSSTYRWSSSLLAAAGSLSSHAFAVFHRATAAAPPALRSPNCTTPVQYSCTVPAPLACHNTRRRC